MNIVKIFNPKLVGTEDYRSRAIKEVESLNFKAIIMAMTVVLTTLSYIWIKRGDFLAILPIPVFLLMVYLVVRFCHSEEQAKSVLLTALFSASVLVPAWITFLTLYLLS